MSCTRTVSQKLSFTATWQLSGDNNSYDQACHVPEQSLQNHPSPQPGGWAGPWSAEEMMDVNVKEWTSLSMLQLLIMASHRKDWKRISAELSLMSSQ